MYYNIPVFLHARTHAHTHTHTNTLDWARNSTINVSGFKQIIVDNGYAQLVTTLG